MGLAKRVRSGNVGLATLLDGAFAGMAGNEVVLAAFAATGCSSIGLPRGTFASHALLIPSKSASSEFPQPADSFDTRMVRTEISAS